MTTIVARVDDYQEFWRELVEPDYRDFEQNIDDLRRAFHCAITLFHLADWIYIAHKAYIDAHFTYTDKSGGKRPVSDEKEFANAIRDLHPDFELIRGIANSAKHLELKRRGQHPSAPIHAANTRSQSTGFGTGTYGTGPYGGTVRVMLEGPGAQDLEFLDLAKSTRQMWINLCQQHNWQLT